jgi:hypothetical protein
VKRCGWSALSLISRAFAASLLLAVGVVSLPLPTDAETEPAPVVIRIVGSQLLGPLADEWTAALPAQNAPVRLDYIPLNSPTGRLKLVDQEEDIVASSIGLLSDELESLEEQRAAGKKPNVVTVPVAASSLNFAELYPRRAIKSVSGIGPTTDKDITTGPASYTAEQLLRQMYVRQAKIDDPDYANAHGYKIYDPTNVEQILNENGELEARPPIDGEFVRATPRENDLRLVFRVGANATNYMLERYMKERSPTLWEQYTPRVGRTVPGENGEPAVLRGDGAAPPSFGYDTSILSQNIARAIGAWRDPLQSFGLFTGIPPAVLKANEAAPALALGLKDTPEVRAAHPEYFLKALAVEGVAPTPESVAKALATSDGISSSDATLPSANGGYPFSYVNKFLVRTDGMSAARANAIATLIRYVVQDGQKEVVKTNDPPLPPFHVLKALKAANEIVKAVCNPADRIKSVGKVTVAGEEVSFDECGPKVAVVPTTTTTTTTVAATSTSLVSSSSSSTSSTTQATVLSNNNTNTNSASRTPAATTARTIAPLVTAPATTAAPVASTTPPITAIAPITTAPKKAAAVKEPEGPYIQPVSKPGRKRSLALPMLMGTLSFQFMHRFAKKRAGEDEE